MTFARLLPRTPAGAQTPARGALNSTTAGRPSGNPPAWRAASHALAQPPAPASQAGAQVDGGFAVPDPAATTGPFARAKAHEERAADTHRNTRKKHGCAARTR
jgi:hypothetical protein